PAQAQVKSEKPLPWAVSPDGRTLVVGDSDTTARRWDIATGQPIEPPLAHPAPPTDKDDALTAIRFSPDGRRVLTADRYGGQLWDAATGLPGAIIPVNGLAPDPIRFSVDSKTVETELTDGSRRRWDPETGQQIGPSVSRKAGGGARVLFSPDGTTYVVHDHGS